MLQRPTETAISGLTGQTPRVEQLSVAIADSIENFRNNRRRHSAVDMITPTESETLITPQLHQA